MNDPVLLWRRWCDKAVADPDLLPELTAMDAAAREDAFYRDLAFGTGGLRGVVGAGTNRMNVYTVARASQGLADYVNARFPAGRRAVAVSYDSRVKSDLFSRVAAAVFAANGLSVWLYPRLMPTPCLSYAVRRLGCAAGVMITASHNPAAYNGYKVYGPDGCQITSEAAAAILREIDKLDIFDGVAPYDFDAALAAGQIRYIGEEVLTAFLEEVRALSVCDGPLDKTVSIVYTPLNGTGREPVTRVLREAGFTRVTVVPEQEQPDGRFPTCPFPNPEIREAMERGIACCRAVKADLLLATDPDCDRCGIAVRQGEDYRLLTGNETGLLLLDYIAAARVRQGTLPPHPVLVKTIVTTDLAEAVAASYGVETVNVLTGFKYIGEVIGRLEQAGRREDYLFGFEESYGYLTGTHVRDKDAVNACLLIAEMFAYYRRQGVGLTDRLAQLYARFGYRRNSLLSYTFEGSAGMRRMGDLMAALRRGVDRFGPRAVTACRDYASGWQGLPPADVLQFTLDDGSSLIVRPSGTEPKLKVYLSLAAADETAAAAAEKELQAALNKRFDC